jgi:hypothetical protein
MKNIKNKFKIQFPNEKSSNAIFSLESSDDLFIKNLQDIVELPKRLDMSMIEIFNDMVKTYLEHK